MVSRIYPGNKDYTTEMGTFELFTPVSIGKVVIFPHVVNLSFVSTFIPVKPRQQDLTKRISEKPQTCVCMSHKRPN